MTVGQSIQRNFSASWFSSSDIIQGGTSVSVCPSISILLGHEAISFVSWYSVYTPAMLWRSWRSFTTSGINKSCGFAASCKSVATGWGTDSGFNHLYFLTREPDFFPSTIRADFTSQGTRQAQGFLSIWLVLCCWWQKGLFLRLAWSWLFTDSLGTSCLSLLSAGIVGALDIVVCLFVWWSAESRITWGRGLWERL